MEAKQACRQLTTQAMHQRALLTVLLAHTVLCLWPLCCTAVHERSHLHGRDTSTYQACAAHLQLPVRHEVRVAPDGRRHLHIRRQAQARVVARRRRGHLHGDARTASAKSLQAEVLRVGYCGGERKKKRREKNKTIKKKEKTVVSARLRADDARPEQHVAAGARRRGRHLTRPRLHGLELAAERQRHARLSACARPAPFGVPNTLALAVPPMTTHDARSFRLTWAGQKKPTPRVAAASMARIITPMTSCQTLPRP